MWLRAALDRSLNRKRQKEGCVDETAKDQPRDASPKSNGLVKDKQTPTYSLSCFQLLRHFGVVYDMLIPCATSIIAETPRGVEARVA